MKNYFLKFESIYKYLKPYKSFYLIACTCTVISTITGIRYRWLIKNLIDDVLVPKKIEILFPLCTFFAILAIVTTIFNVLKSYFFEKVSQGAVKSIRKGLLDRILKFPMEFFYKNNTGTIISTVISDVENLEYMVSKSLVDGASSLVTVLGIFIWLFVIDWQLTLVILLVIPIFIFISVKMSLKIQRSSGEVQQKKAQLTDKVHEAFIGIQTIKIFGIYNSIGKQVNEVLNSLSKAIINRNIKIQIASSLWEVVLIPYQGIFFAFGGFLYIIKGAPTIGTLFAFLNYIGIIIPASMTLIGTIMEFNKGMASLDRILEYMNYGLEEPGTMEVSQKDLERISYKNVCLSIDGKLVLQDINLDINKGEKIAIIGSTGAGKTTIAKLLLKFHKDMEGDIFIGNKNIKELNAYSIRNYIGVVTQDSFLFSGTIKQNFLYVKHNATMDEIEDVCKKVKMHNLIIESTNGYDTIIGERGINLSGGEKQRLAVAMMLLRNPQIVIFDEFTSAMDVVTQKYVINSINEHFKDKTIITITHRLENINKMDNIIVVEQGKIVAKDSYDNLMKRYEPFKKLIESSVTRGA